MGRGRAVSGGWLGGFGFTGPRSPILRELIEAFSNSVDPGVFGIERSARPADHVLVLLVVRIGEGFEELLVARGTANVLWRAGPCGLQKPWVNHARGGLVDPLDPDAVVPVITEVVDILDRPGTGILDDLLQRCLLRKPAARAVLSWFL